MDDGVIRGMAVNGPAVRLQRRACGAGPDDEREQVERVYREAAAAGFAEGLRQGRQEGSASGHDEGLRTGREEAEREAVEAAGRAVATATSALVDERSRLAALTASWQALHGQVLTSAEDEMVALCYEVVCRIVGDVAVRRDTVHAVMVQVVEAAGDQPRLLLRVHPDDAALLDHSGIQGAGNQSVAWRADSAVRLGGCIVESASGQLDARLETLLAGCKTAILAARDVRTERAERAGGVA